MSAAAEIPWIPQVPKSVLHTVFGNSPFAWAQCQREGNITVLSPALEQMLAGRSRTARALRFSDLILPQDRAEGERLWRELFERHRDSFRVGSQTAADGQPVCWTAWRVPGANGEPDSALVLAEDTLRNALLNSFRNAVRDQEAEQRVRQAGNLEAVGRLAGGVAHDFNNLLTGVLLYCDLLMANLEPCHRVRKYAEEIRNAGMQATGLVRQLLAVARPTNGEPQLLSLNESAESMRNLLVRLIGENIELQFHLDRNLGPVKMDPAQFQQILLNLVLNARDAMPAGGRITVETSNCKVQVLAQSSSEARSSTSLPCALFVVGDNGSGMDAATRARLFEAFFTTKAANGTGLGLATVREIVTSNGGLIHVESAVARGTRVSVLLPLVPEAVLQAQKNQDFKLAGTPGELASES
jgi:signal transduction histidine kinase